MRTVQTLAKDALEALREGQTAEAAALLGAIADSPDPARVILADAEPLPSDAIRARGRLIANVALGLARANPAYWTENMRGLRELDHVHLSNDAQALLHGCEFLAAQKGGGA